MKKAIESVPSSAPPRRFHGWAIAAVALGLTAALFLIVGPIVERHAYLEALDDVEDVHRIRRGLRTLCALSDSGPGLDDQLADKTLEERVRVLSIAAEFSCLRRARPAMRAEYFLHRADEAGSIEGAISLGADAVEPALAALRSGAYPERAALVLVGLTPHIDRDDRGRIERRLGARVAPAFTALRAAVGLEEPMSAAAIAPIEPDADAPEADLGALEPDAEAPDAFAPEVDALDGVDAGAAEVIEAPAEPIPGRLMLREPELGGGISAPGRPRILFQGSP